MLASYDEYVRAVTDAILVGGPCMVAQEVGSEAFDFDRLEIVVDALLVEQRKLACENESLRRQLADRNETLEELGQRFSQQEQRRCDALKRIDDLVAQVEGFSTLASQMAGN